MMYPARLGAGLTRIIEAGDPAGPTVLLLHGLGSRADRWRANIAGLAGHGFRVIAPDLPGHGFASKGPSGDYTADAMADALAGLIADMTSGSAHIVGTSLGAVIGAKIALTHRTAVDRLVLIGALGFRPIGAAVRGQLAAGLTDTSPASVERKLRLLVRDPTMITAEWIAEEIKINNSPGAAEALAALASYVRTGIDDDLIGPQLAALADRLPMLLVWGRDDAFMPLEVGLAAKELMPGADMFVVDGAGHAPYLEVAPLFNDRVAEFLRG